MSEQAPSIAQRIALRYGVNQPARGEPGQELSLAEVLDALAAQWQHEVREPSLIGEDDLPSS